MKTTIQSLKRLSQVFALLLVLAVTFSLRSRTVAEFGNPTIGKRAVKI